MKRICTLFVTVLLIADVFSQSAIITFNREVSYPMDQKARPGDCLGPQMRNLNCSFLISDIVTDGQGIGTCKLTLQSISFGYGGDFIYLASDGQRKAIPSSQLQLNGLDLNHNVSINYSLNGTFEGTKPFTLTQGSSVQLSFLPKKAEALKSNPSILSVSVNMGMGFTWSNISSYCGQVQSIAGKQQEAAQQKNNSSTNSNTGSGGSSAGNNSNNGSSSQSSSGNKNPAGYSGGYLQNTMKLEHTYTPIKTDEKKQSSSGSSSQSGSSKSSGSNSSSSYSNSNSSNSSSGSKSHSSGGFGKDEYENYVKQSNDIHNTFEKASKDFSDAVWANYEAERAEKKRKQAAEEAEEERNRERVEAENNRIREEQRLASDRRMKEEERKEKLIDNRKSLLKAYYDGALPLAQDKLSQPLVYCFAYMCNNDITATEEWPLYVTNVFAVGKYNDGGWPYKNDVVRELQALHASSGVTLVGYFPSRAAAENQRSIFLSAANSTDFAVTNLNYKGKNANATSISGGDFWGNSNKSTSGSDVDFWGNKTQPAPATTKQPVTKTTTAPPTNTVKKPPVQNTPVKKEDDFWSK